MRAHKVKEISLVEYTPKRIPLSRTRMIAYKVVVYCEDNNVYFFGTRWFDIGVKLKEKTFLLNDEEKYVRIWKEGKVTFMDLVSRKGRNLLPEGYGYGVMPVYKRTQEEAKDYLLDLIL